jgi:16S rRNA (guanine966-N2)-methyltransferase
LIRDNVKAVGLSNVEVVTATVGRTLTHPPRAPYDIVFLDPPYAVPTGAVLDALKALLANDWLAEDALVVVERSTRDGELPWPEGYRVGRSKKYGETTLWYGHAATESRHESV